VIIVLNKSEVNKRAAEIISLNYSIQDIYYYSNALNLKKNRNSNICVIIDLNEENQLTKENILPETLVKKLIDRGLPNTIQDIYLLISELTTDYPLPIYAHQLARFFSESYMHLVKIHIPSSLSYSMSMISLPLKDQWEVFGINKSDIPEGISEISLDQLLAIKNEQQIWEGKDILGWMGTPNQTYTGIAYVWGEG